MLKDLLNPDKEKDERTGEMIDKTLKVSQARAQHTHTQPEDGLLGATRAARMVLH